MYIFDYINIFIVIDIMILINKKTMKSWYNLPVHLIRNGKCRQIKLYFYQKSLVEAYNLYMELDVIDKENKYSILQFSKVYKKRDISELERNILEKDRYIEEIKKEGIYCEIIESEVPISTAKKRIT